MPVKPVSLADGVVSLWFITPVFERYRLTRICLEQRREEMDRLIALGVSDVQCVVIGNDDNLGTAERLGFHTVEQDNKFLGRKWNDGWQYAIDHGASHIMPVGSDSWVNLDWAVGNFPSYGTVLASRNYAIVHKNGSRRAQIWIPQEFGVHFVVPAGHAVEKGGRPCREDIQRGCDTATLRAMSGFKYAFREVHDLESVAFQSHPQITSYNAIRAKFGRSETFDPFGSDLIDLYGAKLVGAISDFYEGYLDREIEDQIQLGSDKPMSERTGWLLMREIRQLGKLIEGGSVDD